MTITRASKFDTHRVRITIVLMARLTQPRSMQLIPMPLQGTVNWGACGRNGARIVCDSCGLGGLVSLGLQWGMGRGWGGWGGFFGFCGVDGNGRRGRRVGDGFDVGGVGGNVIERRDWG